MKRTIGYERQIIESVSFNGEDFDRLMGVLRSAAQDGYYDADYLLSEIKAMQSAWDV